MEAIEVLFVCDDNGTQVSCTAWDFRTGTNLINYKGGGDVQKRSLNLLHSEYVLAANNSKPLLHVWPINHQEQVSAIRFVLPGRVDALALSCDGFYLVAGIQETIYIWHLTTGRMLNMISKHYQPITCLRFVDNGSHFVSASRDGGILVWNLATVVSYKRDDESQQPLYSFSDHGLPVTDVYIGAGGMRAYMYTCSLDRTCKVYDLISGTLMLSVVFAEALHSIKANALETCVYVGTGVGNIYEFHIDSLPRVKEFHADKEHTNLFKGHKQGTVVNCLVLSIDGHTLISGGQDEQICIWHIPSQQLIKTMLQKGSITNLELRLMHPTEFGPERKQPQVFGGNLKRMLDPPGTEDDEFMEVFITKENRCADEDCLDEGIWKFKDNTLTTNTHRTTSAPTNQNQRSEKDNEEIEQLRAQVKHLKKVNKELFEAAVDSVVIKKK